MDNKNFSIVEILEISLAIIENDGGFKGNSNTGFAGDTPGYQSTKDKVLKFFRKFEGPQVKPEHNEEAKKIIQFFADIDKKKPELNDFLRVVNEIAKSGEPVQERQIGYVVAMCPTYTKMKMDEQFYENSEYVGVAGKRQNFFIKLVDKKYIKGAECYLYTFVDRRQNVIKTWVTMDKEKAFNIKVNDCVDLDAYVNKHEANKYNAVRETYINRIKIVENKGTA